LRLKIAGLDSHCSSWVRIRCIARFGAEVGQLHILIGLFLVILGQRLPCLGVRDESVAHAKSLHHHNIEIRASNHNSIQESNLSSVLSTAREPSRMCYHYGNLRSENSYEPGRAGIALYRDLGCRVEVVP